LHFSPHIFITIKSTTGWDGHVTYSGELNKVYKVSVKKAVRKSHLKETQLKVEDYYNAS
jgi:hypothetical protein